MVSDLETIRVTRRGDVVEAVIAHPDQELNAVDGRLHRDFTRLFADLRGETEARAVLLTGDGPAFSAGGDLGWFPELRSPERLADLRRDARSMIWDLLDVEIPVVCAINGPAVGLGASLALLCDVILMADTATIADPHVRVGLVAGDGGTAIWPLAVGPARAKQYLLTGDPVLAVEAERIGLVNAVVPATELLAEARAWTDRLAAGAPLALRYTKAAVNRLVKDALASSFETAAALELTTFLSEDHAEAVRAWEEKRPPEFRGR